MMQLIHLIRAEKEQYEGTKPGDIPYVGTGIRPPFKRIAF